MNNNIINLNNNQYIISDEYGNIRIVSIKNNEDKSLIEEVFIKENNIEQLEKELDKNKEIVKEIKSKTINGEIYNILIYIGLITLYILIPLSTTGQLIVIGYTYLILKSFNCLWNGTRIGRFLKKRKAHGNINTMESYLKDLRNELEQLKINLKYIELTKKTNEEQKNTYSYVFQPATKNSYEYEPIQEIHGLKLTRKPTKELLNHKADE